MAKTELPRDSHRRLRIRSNGIGPDTVIEVVNDDGSDPVRLDGVIAATWSCRSDELATATLEFLGVEVDVIGEEQS